MKNFFFNCLHFLVLVILFCFPSNVCYSAHYEIPQGLVWFNSDRPWSMQEFKGKFVLVYFWNSNVLNQRGMFEQYKQLQEKFPSELVIIAVHTGKWLDHDRINGRVAEIIGEDKISTPVVVDPDMLAAKAFRLDRWPSAVLFAPDGRRLYVHIGEHNIFSMFSRLVEKKKLNYKDLMVNTPIVFRSTEVSETIDEPSKEFVENDDLAKKTLGDRLLGTTVLDDSIDSSDLEAQDIKEQVPQNLKEVSDIDAKAIADFDEKEYVGEIINIGREYSRKIGKIIIQIQLPDGAHWLDRQQSYVRVFSEDRSWFAQRVIVKNLTEVTVDREIASDLLYADVMLYYCFKGAKSVCIMKPLLFKLPLGSFQQYEDVRIDYHVPLQEI